jgi:hypothetical protein
MSWWLLFALRCIGSVLRFSALCDHRCAYVFYHGPWIASVLLEILRWSRQVQEQHAWPSCEGCSIFFLLAPYLKARHKCCRHSMYKLVDNVQWTYFQHDTVTPSRSFRNTSRVGNHTDCNIRGWKCEMQGENYSPVRAVYFVSYFFYFRWGNRGCECLFRNNIGKHFCCIDFRNNLTQNLVQKCWEWRSEGLFWNNVIVFAWWNWTKQGIVNRQPWKII